MGPAPEDRIGAVFGSGRDQEGAVPTGKGADGDSSVQG